MSCRLKALLLRRSGSGVGDVVGNLLRRDLGETVKLLEYQHRISDDANMEAELEDVDDTVKDLTSHVGDYQGMGCGEGSSVAAAGVRISVGGFARVLYRGIMQVTEL